MNQQQWLAEERRRYLEREALLKRCAELNVLFEKGSQKGAEVATRTKRGEG